MHKKKVKKIIVEKFKFDDDDYVVKKYTIDDDGTYRGLNVCPKFILKLLIHARTTGMSDAELTAIVDRMKWYKEQDESVYIDDSYWDDLMSAAPAVVSAATPV